MATRSTSSYVRKSRAKLRPGAVARHSERDGLKLNAVPIFVVHIRCAFWAAIPGASENFTRNEYANYFTAGGYEADL